VIQIVLPPLRERQDDIAPLAERLLQFFGSANHRHLLGFSEEALNALRNHVWPGNIRELRNIVEHAAIMCRGDRVGLEHLPDALRPRSVVTQLGDPVDLETIEEQHIRRVLASVKSLQEAADILGIDQATLWRRRKQYGI
jgi:NtrC-family two-component system response regulator AlgB